MNTFQLSLISDFNGNARCIISIIFSYLSTYIYLFSFPFIIPSYTIFQFKKKKIEKKIEESCAKSCVKNSHFRVTNITYNSYL